MVFDTLVTDFVVDFYLTSGRGEHAYYYYPSISDDGGMTKLGLDSLEPKSMFIAFSGTLTLKEAPVLKGCWGLSRTPKFMFCPRPVIVEMPGSSRILSE